MLHQIKGTSCKKCKQYFIVRMVYDQFEGVGFITKNSPGPGSVNKFLADNPDQLILQLDGIKRFSKIGGNAQFLKLLLFLATVSTADNDDGNF